MIARAYRAAEDDSQWARLMGVATMANKKTLFVTFVDRAERLEAHSTQFVADFD